MRFREEWLKRHVGIVGKTGSGKTSTVKLAIEEACGAEGRVCVLDPIKSDYYGLTSTRDGKNAGLPFHILGGPHGHVPLHPKAGKATAEVVGSGSLRHSIIDMADFPPGGIAEFFVDFAGTLIKRMKGSLTLVMEEAHLFAPKERSGIGVENMSIYWAKMLAMAGRSKGIRLIVVTQRTQSLHNALLGMCDTLIAHRLTAPADQAPIIAWLKGNTDKDGVEKVVSSLSSLEVGEAWVCAETVERVKFARIKTYDNTATPDDDAEAGPIKTAQVDREALRQMIGAAVQEAEANDPKILRQQIADLQKELKRGKAVPERLQVVVNEAATEKAITAARGEMKKAIGAVVSEMRATANHHAKRIAAINASMVVLNRLGKELQEDAESFAKSLLAFGDVLAGSAAAQPSSFVAKIVAMSPASFTKAQAPAAITSPPAEGLNKGQQQILDVVLMLEQRGLEANRDRVARWMAIHPKGGTYGMNLAGLRSAGMLDGFALTDAGRAAARPMAADRDAALAALPDDSMRRCMEAIIAAGKPLTREELAESMGIHPKGGTYGMNLAWLRTLGIITDRGPIAVTAALGD